MKVVCIENEYNKGLIYVGGKYNITTNNFLLTSR